MKIVAAALLMSASLAAHADTPEQLAKAKSCFACHSMAKKLVGPSFKDIAAKYKNDKAAEDKAAEKQQKPAAQS